MPDDGKRLDYFVRVVDGQPIDVGWAIVVVHVDAGTVTRTCKGCAVSVTTPFDRDTGRVAEIAIIHTAACPIYARIGNNPSLS